MSGVVVLNMPKFDKFDESLENISDLLNGLKIENDETKAENDGNQKAKGQYLQIPAVVGKYLLKWVFEEDIYITGIRYSQSAWKYQDSWDFHIADETVYETVSTKEVGEYKHFNRFEFVAAGTEMTFELANNSGNSRDLWVDVEYLGLGHAASAEVPPPESADVATKSEKIWLEIWDTGAEDNDTVDVYLNDHLVVENFVSMKAPKRVSVEGLLEGANVLRFEGKNSDAGGITCTALIYEEDGETKIMNRQTESESFSIDIPVPHQGRLSPPYPFVEWEIWRN